MNLRAELRAIDDGRFERVLSALDVRDACAECKYMNPRAKETFRCAVLGSCPAVTLSEKTLDYWRLHMGWLR